PLVGRDRTMPYKNGFLFALIFATAFPAVVAVVNFEILNQSVASVVRLFSILAITSLGHVWITFVYYFDPKWRDHFNRKPLIFYVVPVALIGGSIAIMLQPNILVSSIFVKVLIYLNMWHFAKQNWGVTALVGRNRGISVDEMRRPLIYAWVFFLIPFSLHTGDASQFFPENSLYIAAIICAVIYVIFWTPNLFRQCRTAKRDPYVLVFCVAGFLFFIPTVLLFQKPYNGLLYGGAHAAQYYLIVIASLALRERRSASPAKVAAIVLALL